jgi:CheY-like chemotaxis protein
MVDIFAFFWYHAVFDEEECIRQTSASSNNRDHVGRTEARMTNPKTVLIIEDFFDTRADYIGQMTQSGKPFKVIEAASVDEALKAIRKGGFDVIILDGYIEGGHVNDKVVPLLKKLKFKGPIVHGSMGGAGAVHAQLRVRQGREFRGGKLPLEAPLSARKRGRVETNISRLPRPPNSDDHASGRLNGVVSMSWLRCNRRRRRNDADADVR